MPEPKEVKAESTPEAGNGLLFVVPVHGKKRDGKPFLGINLESHSSDDRPDFAPVLSMALMNRIVKANDAELLAFRERCRKALLHKMTHKAVLRNGEVVVISQEEALKAKQKSASSGVRF